MKSDGDQVHLLRQLLERNQHTLEDKISELSLLRVVNEALASVGAKAQLDPAALLSLWRRSPCKACYPSRPAHAAIARGKASRATMSKSRTMCMTRTTAALAR